MSDPEIAEFLKDVVGAVEATHCEHHSIWERYHQKNGVPWIQNLLGHGRTVGYLAEMPVHISLQTAVVNERKILFYHPTSTVVDYRQIETWLEENLPDTARENGKIKKTDATNFHIVSGGYRRKR